MPNNELIEAEEIIENVNVRHAVLDAGTGAPSWKDAPAALVS